MRGFFFIYFQQPTLERLAALQAFQTKQIMEDKLTNLDLITKYLDGELSEQEKQTFKDSLKDADFLEETAFYKDMTSVIQEDGATQQAALLNDIDITKINQDIRASLVAQNERLKQKESGQQTVTVRRLNPMRRILSIAASVLVLVTAGSFWYANSHFSPVALSTNNYLTADIPGTMSGNNTIDATLQVGLNAFWVNKDLTTAKTVFAKIPSGSPEFTEAQYFLGHIAFQEKEYTSAIEKYQAVIISNPLPSYINRDKLTWNVLLARMGAGENIDADLNQILENEEHVLYAQAKQLQAQRSGFWGRLVN